jgi:hypothetical protein
MSCGFLELWNYFSKDQSVESVHGTVDRVHEDQLTGLRIPH